MKRRKLLLLLLMLIVILSGCFGKVEVLTQYVSEETISATLIDATTVTVADPTVPHIESETSAASPSIFEDSISSEKTGALYELILVGENIDKLFYYPSPDGENVIIVKEIPLEYGYQWYFYLNDTTTYLCSGFTDSWTFIGNIPIWINNVQVILAGRYIFDISANTVRALGCGMDNETTEADKEKFADYYKDINQQYSLIGHVDDKYIDKLKAPFNELVGYNFPLPDNSGFINCQTVCDIGTVFTKLDFSSNRFEHIILEEHETEPSGNLYYPLRTDGDNIYFFYNMSERIDGEHNPYSYYCRYDLNTGEIIKKRVAFKMTYDLGEDGFLDADGNLYSASDYEHIYSMSNNEYVILRDIYCETANKEFIHHNHKLYYIDWESEELICYDIQKNEQTVIQDTKLILSNNLAAFKTADGWCLDGYEENGQYYLIKERFVLYEGAIDEGYYVYDKYQFVLEGENQ